jgi:hypothetical protein
LCAAAQPRPLERTLLSDAILAQYHQHVIMRMATDLIFTALCKAARNESPVQLFLEPEQPHHFVVGLVSGRPVAGVVVFINISPNHQPSGVYLWKLSAMTKVGLNNKYLVEIGKGLSPSSDSQSQRRPPIVIKRAGLPMAFRGRSGKVKVVTLQIGKVEAKPFTIRGHLVAIDRTCLCLAQLDSSGNEDGLIICRRKYVDAIDSNPKIMRRPPISGAP